MMVTKPTRGDINWDVGLNAALDDLQDQADAKVAAAANRIFPVTGAVGDGLTDDHAALQAALDAARNAGGGAVIIPAGYTYGVTDYLHVASNTTVFAYGATIKAIGTHGLVRMYLDTDSFTVYGGHSNIRILGGVWDANAYDGSSGTVSGLVNAFTLGHNDGVTFRDVTIRNVSCAHAIDITASRNVHIENCRFEGFVDNTGDASRGFSEAIQLDYAVSDSGSVGSFDNTPCQNIRVVGCYFGTSDRLSGFGRAVGSHTSVDASTWCENIQILHNRVAATGQEGIRAYGWKNAVIADNIISGTGLPCIIITGPDPAVAGYNLPCHRINVHDNTCTGPTGSSTPIRVIGFTTARPTGVRIHNNTVTGSSATGIYVSQATAPAVTANTVMDCGSSSIYAINCTDPHIATNKSIAAIGSALGIDTCTGGMMVGNSIVGAGSGTGHGCFIGGSTDVTVTANRVSAVRGSGIRATSSALRTRITGNTVLRGGVTALGIDVTASATGGMVVGNDLTGSSWPGGTALSILAAGTVMDFAGGTTSPGHNLVS